MTEPQKRILIQASPLEIFHIQQLTFSTRIHRIVYKSKSTMVAYYQLDIIYWILSSLPDGRSVNLIEQN